MTDYILSSSNLNEIENHDDYKVIWFGPRNYVPRELKQFTDYIQESYSFEEYNDHIKNVRSDWKSRLVFAHFIFVQVQSIYIFKKNSEGTEYGKAKLFKID
jgi:hypothetical protein